MSLQNASSSVHKLYRVDKFRIPSAARSEFLKNVRQTHQLLRTLPGFVEDFLLEQPDDAGNFQVITVAIWESGAAMRAARETVAAHYQAWGFSPQELFARLNIEADLATYTELRTDAVPSLP